MAGAEHASPGVAEDVVVVLDPQMRQQIGEFGEKELDGPEGAIAALLREMRGFAAAELVVEDHRDCVLGCEVEEREKVIVRDAGAAVECNLWAVVQSHAGHELISAVVAY